MNGEGSSGAYPELLDDFYAESDELLGNVRAQLTAVENATAMRTKDAAALEALFRSIHSFKGISAMVGFRAAEQLAHATEGFLRHLTRGTVTLTSHGMELLFTATRRLEQMVTAHRLRQQIPGAAELMQELGPFGAAEIASEPPDTPPYQPPPRLDLARQLELLLQRGLAPWRCTFLPAPELDRRGIRVSLVRERLAAIGEIVSATPVVRPGGLIAFEFLVGLPAPPADPAEWERDGIFLHPVDSGSTDDVAALAGGATDGPVEGSGSPGLFIAPSHIVRVDLTRLDELMRITGEMVVHRSRLEERINHTAGDTTTLKEATAALTRSLRQLRAALMRVRLVPLAEILTRMPFVVRDLAQETGRQVRLVLEGQQTEIDKYLVERLKEPLLHLVRNAVSHGVEPAPEREAAGKPREGTLLLRARAAGDFVDIEIHDDGRGIDATEIAARASALGMAVPQELDDAAVLELLCAPGFSTRMAADRVAGRGVGMAVVRNAVRELGGRLRMTTKPGEGTQFTLRLPLTLSITESIIVSAGEQTCAVPQGSVDEIVQVAPEDIRRIKQTEVVPYKDGMLPLLRLNLLFGLEAPSRPRLSILVLSSERGSTGLVVDRVHTQREIVVSPLQDPLVQVPGVVGATDLGDGRPVLIIDPAAITSGVVRPRAATGTAGRKRPPQSAPAGP
jgi:two-component system, chemotaxis family, sensor kinase CheA